MIYSINESANIKYKDYTYNDIGLILYESEINNMRLFEASLQADFEEIYGLREGTLLESDLQAISEANFADFKKKIVAGLEAFWNKIKSMLNNFKNKLLENFESDGKSFIVHFYKQINKNYKHKLSKDIKVRTYDCAGLANIIAQSYRSIPVLDGDKNLDDYVKAWFKQFSQSDTCDTEEKYISYITEFTRRGYTIYSDLGGGVEAVMRDIVDVKNQIRVVNSLIEYTNTSINNCKKQLLNSTNDSNLIRSYNMSVNAFQKVMSITHSTFIKLIRTTRNNARNALQEVLKDACNGEKDGSTFYYDRTDLSYIPDDVCEAIYEEEDICEEEIPEEAVEAVEEE